MHSHFLLFNTEQRLLLLLGYTGFDNNSETIGVSKLITIYFDGTKKLKYLTAFHGDLSTPFYKLIGKNVRDTLADIIKIRRKKLIEKRLTYMDTELTVSRAQSKMQLASNEIAFLNRILDHLYGSTEYGQFDKILTEKEFKMLEKIVNKLNTEVK